MSDKKPFDICIVETYQQGGQEKSNFHRVGVAFPGKDGGFSGTMYPGVSVSGRFLILPRKEKAPDAAV